jgi:glycosyltransferase involved in cell wall biosynthesis
MTPNVLISVIIPVYNAAATIERCIRSIKSTRCGVEIICVDDGSSDNSYSIIENLSKNDCRIKLYHQNNSGAGSARNYGIKMACGEYIMFCDADDTYLSNTIDIITNDIAEYAPDYIVFHRKTITSNNNVVYWGGNRETIRIMNCDWKSYLNEYLQPCAHGLVVYTKVYKREIVLNNGVEFGGFLFGEDAWFLLTYIMHAKSFVEDYRAYYQQYQTEGSICLTPYKDYYDKCTEWIVAFEKQFAKESLYLQPFITHLKYETVQWSISRILRKIDAKSFVSRYRMLKSLCERRDIKHLMRVILSEDVMSSQQKKNCEDILHERYLLYAFRNYYFGKVKSVIRNILQIK